MIKQTAGPLDQRERIALLIEIERGKRASAILTLSETEENITSLSLTLRGIDAKIKEEEDSDRPF